MKGIYMLAMEFSINDSITVVNEIQFRNHLILYQGYINKYNEIVGVFELGDEQADAANSTYSKFRCLKRGESYSLNAIMLHELYFSNIGGKSNEVPSNIQQMMEKYFGSVENWRLDFIATAKASRGWAILAYEQKTKRLMNMSLDTHDMGGIIYAFPLLVLDVYEHAYFLQYGADKTSYINNFLYNINWQVVRDRASALQNLEG
ncbi:superoxide dismutase [Anaerosporobacter sp.]